MKKANVLVLGNSGVGKSTLINAVLGEERAETGWGTEGTTRELRVYENDSVSFRLIDSVGFEPSASKARMAINSVRKWSRNSAKEGNGNEIDLIWFCVDGTAKKLFKKTVDDLAKAISIWKSVPIVVVITKSFAAPEREENIEMVKQAFSQQKKYGKNLRDIIPVVASAYQISDEIVVPPVGIYGLIEKTNELIPEGIRAGKEDLANYQLARKRAFAHGSVGIYTAGAAVVGAVPIPFADAAILTPIEIAEINTIAYIYEVKKDELFKNFLNTIIEAGTVSVAAKAAISALKMIPGVTLAASILNAVVAGAFVAALGEGAIYAFEQVYLGKKSLSDVDWVRKVIESEFSSGFVEKVKKVIEKIGDKTDAKEIAKIIAEVFSKSNQKSIR